MVWSVSNITYPGTAQRIVAAHILPEWRASEKARQTMEGMAQAIADAMQRAREAG
jgi:hypothetical protein